MQFDSSVDRVVYQKSSRATVCSLLILGDTRANKTICVASDLTRNWAIDYVEQEGVSLHKIPQCEGKPILNRSFEGNDYCAGWSFSIQALERLHTNGSPVAHVDEAGCHLKAPHVHAAKPLASFSVHDVERTGEAGVLVSGTMVSSALA